MIALIVLLVGGLWAFFGFALWKVFVRPRTKSFAVRYAVAGGLALFWLIGPVADEILGARQFKRLCDAIPAVMFYGPVEVGSGAFFDENGQRRLWTQREVEEGKSSLSKGAVESAYAEGQRFHEAWKREFRLSRVTHQLEVWPIPVLEERLTYTHEGGKVVLVSHRLASRGGWIKRLTGWGSHAPYQCSSSGIWPREQDWIKYQ